MRDLRKEWLIIKMNNILYVIIAIRKSNVSNNNSSQIDHP